ncbi:ATP-dependent RecD-like DNA helicase [Phototrophicus methaneseepsis]|uniref:ATP-dependent RecD2 DNA helicase n=1 Tax=Phototrophicus methaneseepsis TaxID=2710758 RepID=A0A7S8IF94_9CHLR|nr:ATP-dependent RecD-like DNA helicase [Phototrophicus methaneseepsis]QPC84495.1 ATP-dependent RecD-like DNA helicase [Phototrophicus methaneseepsis]
MTLISGNVRRIVFRNEENGYTVLKAAPDSPQPDAQAPDGTITLVGILPSISTGDSLEVEGNWVDNARFGLQFQISTLLEHDVNGGGNAPQIGTESISGTVERITYYNEENGYSVIKIDPDGSYPEAQAFDGLVAVVGIMPELIEGEAAEFSGKWIEDPRYGKQFRAEGVMPIAPRSEKGITRYIADTVYGIGPATAQRIYDHFGEKTMEVLDMNPQRVWEVPGLKPNLAENLIKQWEKNRVERQVMVYLQEYGISTAMARRIYEAYGSATISMVQADPYQLADDISGIGFKRADRIARGMGIPVNSRQRLRAGLGYALSQLALEGHTYAPAEKLFETAQDLLDISEEDSAGLMGILQEQVLADKLRREDLHYHGEKSDAVYLPIFYHAEVGIAKRLGIMAQTPSVITRQMKDTDWKQYLVHLAKENNVELTSQQQGAVQAALTSKISVLTGGPGTGKTTTLRMVINALEQEGYQYHLASPTGRASKRLSEATGRPAQTIHRLLGFNPQEGGFEYDEDNPLEGAIVIIDEASMLDLLLFYSLVNALRETSHLMLVGDVDQLPSVGAGNVLNDVINSNIAHVTRLDQIFRQDDASHIVLNAHRINQGEMPLTDNQSKDFFFFNFEDAATAGDMIIDIVVNRLPERFGINPIDDVQVIAPMYRGPAGVDALNTSLQKALNGKIGVMEKRLDGKLFRQGDKVMQTRNNYEKEVFNGDIGFVRGFDDDENIMEVVIDDRIVTYDYSETDDLRLAYCISTHRSQGSEYPVVVMPILTTHYIMLQRNLLYTAITRAKQMVVLVGSRKAVAIAVENNKVSERYSGLLARLVVE